MSQVSFISFPFFSTYECLFFFSRACSWKDYNLCAFIKNSLYLICLDLFLLLSLFPGSVCLSISVYYSAQGQPELHNKTLYKKKQKKPHTFICSSSSAIDFKWVF